MGLETATFISGLNASNPVGATDPKSQGDDHLRLIKTTLLNTLPNLTGAMTASHTELNNLDGVTGKTGTGNVVLSASPTLTGTLAADAITASGVISGDGSGLTALNASSLASGTVADARLSSNVPLIDAENVFTASVNRFASSVVNVQLQDIGSGTDEGIWAIRASPATLQIGRTISDAGAGDENAITLSRSGTAITEIALAGDSIKANGSEIVTTAGDGLSKSGASLAVDSSVARTTGATFTGDITMSGTRAIDATTRLNLTGTTVSAGESGGNLGFYGSAGSTKGSISGTYSTDAGGIAAVLDQLLSNLAVRGLITDNTTRT